MDEIRKNLQEIVGRIEGLYSIMITDRDGVPLLKVIRHYIFRLCNTNTNLAGKHGQSPRTGY